MKRFTLGFSPCPNDTFIFDALVNKKIDTQDLEFDVVLEDVQTLNKWALNDNLDISKISYGVLPLVLNNYTLLNSGGALGKGAGPLLIAKEKFELNNINEKKIAIPGENTTAHILFSIAFPSAQNKLFKVFNEIEDAVLSGEVDAGVIIHENRFTYQQKGLIKLIDLGDFWENKTGLPIPLGGIVAKRSIDTNTLKAIDGLIKQSVEYSFKYNYQNLSDYVKQHAQEMSEDVMRKHVDLYVNNYSVDLGDDGKNAIQQFMKTYASIKNETIKEPDSVFI